MITRHCAERRELITAMKDMLEEALIETVGRWLGRGGTYYLRTSLGYTEAQFGSLYPRGGCFTFTE
jgi:hypothetical protein